MDKLHQTLNKIGKVFDAVWSYDLVIVSGNHIRISNIIMAILLFLMGVKLSRRFSLTIKNYIRSRVNSDKDAANALEKIIKYVALCVFVVTILEISNVPLSTFAFVGGALAIGIGFGAQTVISNFISSIIIMIERPIKIGDIIEIEGVVGMVTSVGARCVILNTSSNVDVLIPNSKFMQNTLINWTLTDSAIRYSVELNISRKTISEFKPENLINKLREILGNIEVILKDHSIEINLVSIRKETVTFLLNFYCDLSHVQNLEYIKSQLNLALFNNLKLEDFTVEYLKAAEIKQVELEKA